MRGVFADCSFAIRLLGRTPLSSALAIAALAIAIGFVSSLLSLYVDLRFRANRGYEDSGELITLGQGDGETLNGLPFGLLELMAEEMTSITAVAGSSSGRLLANEAGDTINVEFVSRGFFDGLRPRLHAGRGFEPDEHRRDGERVAVISYRYWQDALGGEDVLGTTIVVDLQPTSILANAVAEPSQAGPPEFRIVGILARDVSGFVDDAAIWLPFEQAAPFDTIGPPEAMEQDTQRARMSVLARRAEGVSTAAVIAEMRSRYSEVTGYIRISPGQRPDAVDGFVTDLSVLRESKRQLLVLLAASVMLAFVAAANVSLFLLARAPGRRRELGVRMAVGAPLGRLGRQLATEAATLVIVASALGLVLGVWISQFLQGLAFLRQANWNDVALLDWRVLGAVAAFLLILTVLVSLAPVLALRLSGIDAASRAATARATPLQRIAGTVQIAVAGVLGGAAIAFGWHMTAILFDDPGFDSEGRFTVTLEFNLARAMSQGASPSFSLGDAELRIFRERLEAIPGVSGVTFGYPMPGDEFIFQSQIRRPDNPDEYLSFNSGSIDGSYVDVLGLRLLYGRGPGEDEVDGVLVNRAFAQSLWGRDDVVGERMARAAFGNPASVEVIGVLEDVSFGHPLAAVPPMRLGVIDRLASYRATIASSLTAAQLAEELRRLVATGDLEFSVGRVMPLARLRDGLIAPDRARSLLTIGTASLVVLLAALGFYGTERYLVSAGRREYAIRASLGAGPAAIGRLVCLRAILFALPGLVLAALLAFITVGWLRADYVTRDVSASAVTVAVVVGLAGLLLAASLGPARSAMRTQPAPLLREE